jgi:uncharacterized protein YdeI (BOF family)
MKKTFFLLLFLLPMMVKAQVALTTNTSTYSQNFDALITTGTATWEDNKTIINWYAARSVAGVVTLRSNNGTGNSGGLQSFGTTTDRAIGGIGSGSNGTNAFGLRLKNSSGATLSSVTISYNGEQWRNGGNVNANKLAFSYSISSTAFTAVSINPTDSSYVGVSNLDFTSPIVGATAAALDGNLAANRTAISYTISGINFPDGSEMMIRWFDADDVGSDHGIGIDDLVVNTGNIVNTTPTVSISPTSLSGFSTTEGAASTTKTYTVSGINLKADIVATAPNGFEISTSAATGFASTLNFAPANGTVATTTVYVRLKGTTIGNFTGNITHTSTDATIQNISLSGLVAGVATLTPIATAKGLVDNTVVTVEGRLTVTSQYGGKLVYVQDATGGLAIFANNTAIYPNNWQIGDSVRVTGPIVTFSGKREIVDPTLVTIVAGQTNKPLAPSVITADKLNVNEGSLVTINNAGFINVSGNFAGAQNYSFATCSNLLGVLRINNSVNNLVGTAIPKTIQNLTGVVENFNGSYQILPRFTTDLGAATSQCDISGALCNPAAVVIPDSNINFNTTLDVVAWNIEWFGNLTQTPANDTLQANNIKCALEKLKSDIMVLVEVCDTNKLRAILPTGYDVRFSGKYYSHFFDTGETAADLAQKVAVVYNKSTITPIEAECKALLSNFADFSASGATNSFWASGRLPYMFTANATINNVTRKIRVVGIHAKAGSDAASYTRRVSDVSALKKHLDSLYTKDLLILAGDYNDDVDTSISAGKSSSYADFVKDTNYVVLTKALSASGKKSTASFTDMIDHITATKSLAAFYVPNSVNVATANTMNFIPDYSATTTDHFPVWARFKLLTSSVQTIREDFKTQVYPNPTENIINIAFDKIADDTEISLYDISGKVVFNKKYASTTLVSMDLTPFPNGFYHLEVKQGTAISLKKVVKF